MKKTLLFILCTFLMISCGSNSGKSKSEEKSDPEIERLKVLVDDMNKTAMMGESTEYKDGKVYFTVIVDEYNDIEDIDIFKIELKESLDDLSSTMDTEDYVIFQQMVKTNTPAVFVVNGYRSKKEIYSREFSVLNLSVALKEYDELSIFNNIDYQEPDWDDILFE